MTTLAPTTAILRDEDHDDPVLRRSAGRAAPYSRGRIVDETDREASLGEVGELVVAGDHVMLGYWKKPAETAATVRNGWCTPVTVDIWTNAGYRHLISTATGLAPSRASSTAFQRTSHRLRKSRVRHLWATPRCPGNGGSSSLRFVVLPPGAVVIVAFGQVAR